MRENNALPYDGAFDDMKLPVPKTGPNTSNNVTSGGEQKVGQMAQNSGHIPHYDIQPKLILGTSTNNDTVYW